MPYFKEIHKWIQLNINMNKLAKLSSLSNLAERFKILIIHSELKRGKDVSFLWTFELKNKKKEKKNSAQHFFHSDSSSPVLDCVIGCAPQCITSAGKGRQQASISNQLELQLQRWDVVDLPSCVHCQLLSHGGLTGPHAPTTAGTWPFVPLPKDYLSSLQC